MQPIPPSLNAIYEELLASYGPQHWWPARTRAEMMIGAILTQNTAWTNVEKALSNLRKHQALDFRALAELPAEQLAEWIRPAGFLNQKTTYLKAFADMLRQYDESIDRLFRLDTPALRRQLLAVKGVGPETADCILLYAARRPVFVVDAYTRRLLAAYGYKNESRLAYSALAEFFMRELPLDVQFFNEYHALIVRWGKDNPKQRKSAR